MALTSHSGTHNIGSVTQAHLVKQVQRVWETVHPPAPHRWNAQAACCQTASNSPGWILPAFFFLLSLARVSSRYIPVPHSISSFRSHDPQQSFFGWWKRTTPSLSPLWKNLAGSSNPLSTAQDGFPHLQGILGVIPSSRHREFSAREPLPDPSVHVLGWGGEKKPMTFESICHS